jgi:hypothetical protein
MSTSTLNSIIERLDALKEQVEVVAEVVTGNGDPSKGLIVRLDRVEQSMAQTASRLARWRAATLTVAMTVLGVILTGAMSGVGCDDKRSERSTRPAATSQR